MHFLYPGFLFALFFTAIPVIIHLFTFRKYKTVYFSNINWLRGVKKDDKSKSRLRQLLVLFTRILIIAMLVIAFAQPYIPESELSPVKDQQTCAVYIDNSFSMENILGEVNLLDIARNYTLEIINSQRPDTRYYLITNDFEQKHQHLFNKDQLISQIGSIRLSPNRKNLDQVVNRSMDFFNLNNNPKLSYSSQANNYSIYLISDFQKNISNFEEIPANIPIKIVPVPNIKPNNLFIDSVWFETPKHNIHQSEKIFVSIRNISGSPYSEIPLKLIINDSLKSLDSFDIPEESTIITELAYTNSISGIIQGVLELNDYPVTYDNKYYFSYEVKEKIEILIIDGQNSHDFLGSVFEIDDFFKLNSYQIDNILSYDFTKFNLIILNSLIRLNSGLAEAILRFVNEGGNILIIPYEDADINSYNLLFDKLNINRITGKSELACMVEFVDYENDIYSNTFKEDNKNLDLPSFSSYFLYSNLSSRSEIALIKNNKNEKILSLSKTGQGKVYNFSVPIKESDQFKLHPLFFPTIYNIALLSSRDHKLYYTLGKNTQIDLPIELPGPDIHLTNSAMDIDIIPLVEENQNHVNHILYTGNDITTAGNYILLHDTKPIAGLSFNYDRLESILDYYTYEELRNLAEMYQADESVVINPDNSDLKNKLNLINHGHQLWRIFVLAALGFIALEITLLRLWK